MVRNAKRTPASAIAARDRLIIVLLEAGHPGADVALVAGLSTRQIARIHRAAGAQAPPHPSTLTPLEVRELRREHRTDPEALEWLAGHRTDRRRNGRPMPSAT